MLSRTALKTSQSAKQARSAETFKAFYATIRNLRVAKPVHDLDDIELPENDFILSILRANPSSRDAKHYLQELGAPRPKSPPPLPLDLTRPQPSVVDLSHSKGQDTSPDVKVVEPSPIVASILNPVHRRIALVKVEGPFTNRQLESIARGMVYLEKLGLLSVVVVENAAVSRDGNSGRTELIDETTRVAAALEHQGVRCRPFLSAVVRLGPHPDEASVDHAPEAHTLPADLIGLRSAIRMGEIPVLAPMALDSFCRSAHVDANDVVAALAKGMVEAAALDKEASQRNGSEQQEIDLTPLRLMIINREGGVPSYAREGLPHLLVNTAQEHDYIHETFQRQWRESHPTALANLSLARTCLHYMPPTSSAVMVSHRSPSELIANLITNKPAVSSSLPHALLQNQTKSKLTPHTPTLLRRGLPVDVFRSIGHIDKAKLTHLLEASFKRTLDADTFYTRLEKSLDFIIVAGDYAGAAIVTREQRGIAYLDKFAVLPSHQGDGTVDFLWVALHDESYGLGLSFSANPNGGKGGQGEGTDLVWRSRADNPVNKWYFERATGHVRIGKWVLFWCDAEVRLKTEEGRRANEGLKFVEAWEGDRVATWVEVVDRIPSAWK